MLGPDYQPFLPGYSVFYVVFARSTSFGSRASKPSTPKERTAIIVIIFNIVSSLIPLGEYCQNYVIGRLCSVLFLGFPSCIVFSLGND